MRTLVLGGIRSGKSRWAEEVVVGSAVVRYLATAPDRPGDEDWAGRVMAHRVRRPATWRTEEVGGDPALLTAALRASSHDDVLLVDDLGTWLVGALDTVQGWDLADPWGAVAGMVDDLCDALASCPARTVLVSPEVGWTVVPATRSGRVFVDAQGTLNQRIAACCDNVVLVVAGRALMLPPTGQPAGSNLPE
jgi:adenosyl cobinamide kinase/adenosyl cobinamide phosphate guanylyltransferase